MDAIVDVRTFARILGIAEILAGQVIALRPWVPLLSVLGGPFAVVLFAVTLTLLLTTPTVYDAAGFPQLSPMPGQLLAKDLLLLAAAIWVVGDALAAMSRRRRVPDRYGGSCWLTRIRAQAVQSGEAIPPPESAGLTVFTLSRAGWQIDFRKLFAAALAIVGCR